jgi:hypothetical protein
MLLQISNKDSLNSLPVSDWQTVYSILFLIIGISFFGIILFLILKLKKTNKDLSESDIKNETKTNTNTKAVLNIEQEKIKRITTQKLELKNQENKSDTTVIKENSEITIEINVSKTLINKIEIEDQSNEKYIGYNPINLFAQTEPLNYPYVLMPNYNSVIKFPRKGRSGRKGYKEEDFKKYIDKYFKSCFQIFDDRFILIKNSSKPFEPDFTIIDEKNGINIFIDIEIDEPYEGINDVVNRKPTHFQYSDTNRNNAFKNRGWIIIRFAEIQVHQQPDSCCLFIFDVINSINPTYEIPETLTNIHKIEPIRQWTKEEAEIWSINKYRENYLGILVFGIVKDNITFLDINETELGNKIEEKVIDDKIIIIPKVTKKTNPIIEQINSSIKLNKYLSFKYIDNKTIVNPIKLTETTLTAFCYVKNCERFFEIKNISDLKQKDNYYTLRVAGPSIGLVKITTIVNTAINYHRHIRMKYTRRTWNNMLVDVETGELLIDRIEAKESIRTINDVQLAITALTREQIENFRLNKNYITAYCNKREEQRTFKFERIGEIEILDI